ncbi:AAA family ATPase [bacterium]|nr:AAA family ATPase [bacterium]
MLKRLPIGQQDFASIIDDNNVYADKTKIIYELLQTARFFFLSRPRRFGKSLLISTLKYLFEGRKELFKGLWIEDKIEWKKHPVIRIDFTAGESSRIVGLAKSIESIVDDEAKRNKVSLSKETHSGKLAELINTLYETTGEKVVVLVDEYDKPLIEHINNPDKAEENRLILRDFYGILKPCSDKLKMVFLTGISRFSKLSIFSELNNLKDISMDKKFASICGFTKDDLKEYFSEYKGLACEELQLSREKLDEEITYWYDGYKFDGETHVYNPFSMLNFFCDREFKNYWFNSGLPKVLVDFIREHGVDIKSLENSTIDELDLNNFDVLRINFKSLMFQTGYLTITGKNKSGKYILDYPNEEVRQSFAKYLISNFTDQKYSDMDDGMMDALRKGEIDRFIIYVNSLLASIPYQIIPEDHENYFSSLIYVMLRVLAANITSELSSYKGRADAVIKTNDFIYIFEYKMAPSIAASGINQIKMKGYADEFAADPRKKTAVSIVIDKEKRQITEYLIEEL